MVQKHQKRDFRITKYCFHNLSFFCWERTIFTKKKEGVREFVEKKRQILLSRMNIMMKMDETNRLTEFIMNQEESLNAQEAVK